MSLATNETHSVKEFVQETFAQLDMDWEQYVDYDKQILNASKLIY